MPQHLQHKFRNNANLLSRTDHLTGSQHACFFNVTLMMRMWHPLNLKCATANARSRSSTLRTHYACGAKWLRPATVSPDVVAESTVPEYGESNPRYPDLICRCQAVTCYDCAVRRNIKLKTGGWAAPNVRPTDRNVCARQCSREASLGMPWGPPWVRARKRKQLTVLETQLRNIFISAITVNRQTVLQKTAHFT